MIDFISMTWGISVASFIFFMDGLKEWVKPTDRNEEFRKNLMEKE